VPRTRDSAERRPSFSCRKTKGQSWRGPQLLEQSTLPPPPLSLSLSLSFSLLESFDIFYSALLTTFNSLMKASEILERQFCRSDPDSLLLRVLPSKISRSITHMDLSQLIDTRHLLARHDPRRIPWALYLNVEGLRAMKRNGCAVSYLLSCAAELEMRD